MPLTRQDYDNALLTLETIQSVKKALAACLTESALRNLSLDRGALQTALATLGEIVEDLCHGEWQQAESTRIDWEKAALQAFWSEHRTS